MRKSILNILAFLGGALLVLHLLLFLLLTGYNGSAFSLQASLLLLFGGLGGIATRFLILQRRQSRDRETNLALVVRTVRHIHLLLAEKKSRDELLQSICRILVEEGHYFSAWLALINQEGKLISCVENGLGAQFSQARQDMEKGVFPACAKKALSGKGLVVRGQATRCAACPLAMDDAERVCFTIKLNHHDQTYGLLSVATASASKHDLTEQILFTEIAQDVAQALYFMELEAQRAITENRFRDLVENSLAGILLIQDDAIIYRNPEQKKIFGPLPADYRPDAFTGVHPDDLAKVKNAYGRVSRGEAASVDVDFRFFPQQHNAGEKIMKWVFCRASRIDYQGRETVIVSMVDITRNKELEQIVQVQDKMSSLGRVAAGIAHEIRNPLSGINIYLDTLAKIHARGENLETAGEIIDQAQAASGKIESVIRRVIDFSRPSHPHLIMTEVNQSVENALSLCAGVLLRDRVQLKKELTGALPHCFLDVGLIEQVLLNLLTNASEALRGAEIKIISVRTALENEAVVIRVGDSGPGISADLQNKIFDPFYTTKGEGAGIGLSLCRRIIHDHHGALTVEASAWGGAEFVIALPAEPKQGE